MGKKRKEKEGDKDREETDERETPSKKSKIEEDKVEEEGGRSVSKRSNPLCEKQQEQIYRHSSIYLSGHMARLQTWKNNLQLASILHLD